MTENSTRVLIIGAGPAGYTAAIYAARANLEPILITGAQPGGQLTITTDVENFPGFAAPVQGNDLMEEMSRQAERYGARIIFDTIVDVDFSTRPMRATGEMGEDYFGDTVVIATGAKARWLNVPGEQDFLSLGVSACATCDGFPFNGKKVVVVGGGNTAAEEALFMANIAERVTVIHRRDQLRADSILQDRLRANARIDFILNSVVEEIVGKADPGLGVAAVRLRDTVKGMGRDFDTDGVFISIGHDPATELFRGTLDMDPQGYIRVRGWSTETSMPGVFAAGDVADPRFRQAVTAAGMGCMAALEAERWLATNLVLHSSLVESGHGARPEMDAVQANR